MIDGGVRDLAEIRRLGFCAWSRGVTPITGKLRVECLELKGPMECAGVQVNPGDLVVADDNGSASYLIIASRTSTRRGNARDYSS
jgi:4-hydroxy-4-methyl-2-oxoglutarate aldolase